LLREGVNFELAREGENKLPAYVIRNPLPSPTPARAPPPPGASSSSSARYDLVHSSPHPPSGCAASASRSRPRGRSTTPVIHRNIKSTNALLDANLGARLGDFGFALRMPKRLPRDAAATTVPAGTLGYLDPAYVMLEIMSGHRRPALARRRTTRSLRRSAERGEVDNAEKLVAVMRV
jgi:serine/threonine protein kinase